MNYPKPLDRVDFRLMRILVLTIIASIAIVIPLDGFAARPARTVLAQDSFGRARTGTWGAADLGGRYVVRGHSSGVAVGAGKGLITLKRVGADATVSLAGTSVKNAVIRFKFGMPDATRAGNLTAAAIFRSRGSSQYRIRVRVAADRSVWL